METSRKIIKEASHKGPYVLHIIVCPRLMTYWWRKALRKDSKLMFTIPTGFYVWPNMCHDTLYIYLITPATRRSNWKGQWIIREKPTVHFLYGEFGGGYKSGSGKDTTWNPFHKKVILPDAGIPC